MNGLNWTEILGYAASIIVAVSLTMHSIVKLRVINLAGSFAFGTYGLLIGAYPVAVLNYFISVTNIYYLWKIHKAIPEKV